MDINKIVQDIPKNNEPDPPTDALWHDFRSAFIVASDGPPEWRPFSYGRSGPVAGTDKPATRAHTNVYRSGDSGLPKDFEMWATSWRASVNVPLSTEVLAWAAETFVEFKYNDRPYWNASLADLLLSRQMPQKVPLHMRENLAFEVVVRSENLHTLERLQDSLHDPNVPDNVRRADEALQILERVTSSGTMVGELRRVRQILRPTTQLICWIHLEGPLRRVVI